VGTCPPLPHIFLRVQSTWYVSFARLLSTLTQIPVFGRAPRSPCRRPRPGSCPLAGRPLLLSPPVPPSFVTVRGRFSFPPPLGFGPLLIFYPPADHSCVYDSNVTSLGRLPLRVPPPPFWVSSGIFFGWAPRLRAIVFVSTLFRADPWMLGPFSGSLSPPLGSFQRSLCRGAGRTATGVLIPFARFFAPFHGVTRSLPLHTGEVPVVARDPFPGFFWGDADQFLLEIPVLGLCSGPHCSCRARSIRGNNVVP